MVTRNPKRKEIVQWIEPDPLLGVDVPELQFFKDPACSEKHDFVFPLTDRGQTVELSFYLQNTSDRSVYDLQLKPQAEPDPDWPTKKSAVGPMHLQVEPSEVAELKSGHVLAGKLIWSIADDERCDKRQASILLTGRFTE